MRAVRCHEGRVGVVDVAPSTGDGVRVRVRSAGICGSDLAMVAGSFPVPVTLGHEIAGELEDGTAVVVEPLCPCGECEPCRAGRYNLCLLGPSAVLGVGLDGGMAEEVLVPERCVVLLPRGVAVQDAALIEPLAVGLHGLDAAGAETGMRVGVVGGGSIGLCAAALAARRGCEVALAARHAPQIAAGAALGAEPISEPLAEGLAGTCDLVVDAAGTRGSAELAVQLARPGGRMLLLATYWQGMVLPGFELGMKEISIVPSYMYACLGATRDVERAAEHLAERPGLARALITHRLPLESAREAFRVATDRKGGAIKVVLEP